MNTKTQAELLQDVKQAGVAFVPNERILCQGLLGTVQRVVVETRYSINTDVIDPSLTFITDIAYSVILDTGQHKVGLPASMIHKAVCGRCGAVENLVKQFSLSIPNQFIVICKDCQAAKIKENSRKTDPTNPDNIERHKQWVKERKARYQASKK